MRWVLSILAIQMGISRFFSMGAELRVLIAYDLI